MDAVSTSGHTRNDQNQSNATEKVHSKKCTCARHPTKCSRRNCDLFASIDQLSTQLDHIHCSADVHDKELVKTKLTRIDAGDADYNTISAIFQQRVPTSSIRAILRIQMPREKTVAFSEYLRKSNQIVNQMYHGTRGVCSLASLLNRLEPNCMSGCGVCGIIREGNRSMYSRHNGDMWFASCPSVSIGYCGGAGPTMKAIFVVDVVATLNNGGVSIVRYDN
ncbi:8334_t:CDS:2, partial [Paraglomus brasilianum]